jgi:magnesium-transporting ATPase (P-type)
MHDRRFREVAAQLVNAGVSPRRVRRLVAELTDHCDDLREELLATGLSREEADTEAVARLATDAMVEDVLARPELRSWVRRWPWISFTVVPIAMFAVLFVATLAALVFSIDFAVNSLGLDFGGSTGLRSFARAVAGFAVWVLPIAAASACCALALSRRAPAIWTMVGVLLISSIGALTNAQVEFPPAAPHGVVGAGIGFSTDALLLPISRAALTLTVVLAAYFWLRNSQRRAESAEPG